MSWTYPNLGLGMSSPEVGNWQRFLNEQGTTDWVGSQLTVDEIFGARTAHATRSYQVREGINPSGRLDELTRKRARAQGFIQFVQAQHCTVLYPKTRYVGIIVIHTMECIETPDAAENVALWFAGRTKYPAPQASAHYCVDEDSVTQCVRDSDVSWHANQVNGVSIGIEHAGFAKQSQAEWDDSSSRAMLWRSAKLTARLCKKFAIPTVKLAPEDLTKPSARGLCGHVDVTVGFMNKGGHVDPGPHFPWSHYIALVQAAM